MLAFTGFRSWFYLSVSYRPLSDAIECLGVLLDDFTSHSIN